jgi:hypothetical protein
MVSPSNAIVIKNSIAKNALIIPPVFREIRA